MICDAIDDRLGQTRLTNVRCNPRRLRFDPQQCASLALAALLLGAVGIELGHGGLAAIVRAPSESPVFWIVFALLYLAPTVAEWTIFRRLWGLPAVGVGALLRKQVSNELVFGYAGDAQFYLWARTRLNMPNSPFGAVKDVAILSAVAGNSVTILLMAASAPLLAQVVSGPFATTFIWSVALIAGSSLMLFAFRRRLFSLARRDLLFVFGVHVLRILIGLMLLALLSHMLLPAVSIDRLLVLVTLRMMISRLPLLPAKDLLFAAVVSLLFGADCDVVPAVTLIGGLIVSVHLVVGIGSMLLAATPKARIA